MEKTSSIQSLEIPKIIHFIWAGGKVLLKNRNIETIKNWAIKNPNYKIYLWIDKKTAPENKDLVIHYREVFKDLNVECKDIQEENISSQIVRYEIDRIDPNYGASSDLLRYKILYTYGGAYFDSDINPGKANLNQIFEDKKFEHHVVYIDHLSQMPEPPSQGLEKFELKGEIQDTKKYYGIGNDTFICTPNNPLIMLLIEKAEANFKNLNVALKVAYSSHNIKDLTIEKTGPSVVSHVILDKESKLIPINDKYFIKQINNINVEIHPVRCKAYELTKPIQNFKDWLDVPLVVDNIPQIYDKLMNTIQFELDYFHIIRLDDHLRHLMQIAKELYSSVEDCIDNFMIKLKGTELNYTQVVFAQSVSLDPRVKDFYEEKGLITKTLLSLAVDKFRQVAEWVTSKQLFSSVGYILSDVTITFENLLATGVYTNQQVLNFAQQLEIGIIFIKKILQDNSLEKIGSTADDNFCYDLCDSYIKVAKALNKYRNEEQINIKELEALKNQLDDFFTEKLLSTYTYAEEDKTEYFEEEIAKTTDNQQKIYGQSNFNLFVANKSKAENEEVDSETKEKLSNENNNKRNKPEENDDDNEINIQTKKTKFNPF